MKLDRTKIQILLARKCMNMADLSGALNLTKQQVYNILRQQGKTQTKTAGKLAKALGVDVVEILEKEKINHDRTRNEAGA